MKAVVYHGVGHIRFEGVAEPRIEAPTDAIVRITASAMTFGRRDRGWIKVELQPQRSNHAGLGSEENVVDKVIADTFPASDPTSMQHPR